MLIDPSFVPGPTIVATGVLNVLVIRREGTARVDHTVDTAIVGQVAGVLGAGLLLAAVADDTLSLLFAALVLLAVGLSVAGWHLAKTRFNLVGVGVLSGFMGTISGIGGPPIALVYQHADGPTLRATLARYFTVGNVVAIPTLIVAGPARARRAAVDRRPRARRVGRLRVERVAGRSPRPAHRPPDHPRPLHRGGDRRARAHPHVTTVDPIDPHVLCAPRTACR